MRIIPNNYLKLMSLFNALGWVVDEVVAAV